MASKPNARILILIIIMLLSLEGAFLGRGSFASNNANFYQWTQEELSWLDTHRGSELSLGLDPFVGMDYYLADGKAKGYVIDVVSILERDLGLHITIVDDKSWDETLRLLKQGKLDIIFGANATEERKAYMSFTAPLHQYPYNVYALKSGPIRTLGDLDGKKVGFIAGDAVSDDFPKIYNKIKYTAVPLSTQQDAMKAVLLGQIDAFITDSSGITKKYAHDFSNLTIIADLTTFTSDMTLSTGKKDDVLARIMDKVLVKRANEINGAIERAADNYNRYIINLTPEEERWLRDNPKVVVGAADDYLPFDYYKEGRYRGIAGDYLTEVADQVGLKLEVVHGPFDVLYDKALKHQIKLLNMAKTDSRKEWFDFTNAFSEERDELYGRRSSPYLQDIYELENKRVAVVKGYWHEDYLVKNLSNVTIVQTKDLQESLKLVSDGAADYFIENPTVANYYIDGLGYSSIIEKGTTSQDSFLYFGIPKGNELLVSILNKAMPLVRYEKVKSSALQEVPAQSNVTTAKLIKLLLMLLLVLTGVIFYLAKLAKELINQKARQK